MFHHTDARNEKLGAVKFAALRFIHAALNLMLSSKVTRRF
jgi:hypothetical protein